MSPATVATLPSDTPKSGIYSQKLIIIFMWVAPIQYVKDYKIIVGLVQVTIGTAFGGSSLLTGFAVGFGR